MKNKWIVFPLLGLLSACNGWKVDQILSKSSPYENYLEGLETSALRESAMVMDWKEAGESVFNDSVVITLPYSEMSYFDPKSTGALLIRYVVVEGHEININWSTMPDNSSSYFLDIFEWETSNGKFKRIHSADSTEGLNYKVKKSGQQALRVQPELLTGGLITIQIDQKGLLGFPIPGKTSRNIASFWGDPRDGDARKHEGIDVFAARGTPVLAASEGRIRRVGTNRLGGNVIWLHSSEMGHSQYYAHLDSQAVQVGQLVNAGDTIGYVGNTGNAITTAPHLHFGIYKTGTGAVNPFPFVQEAALSPEIPLTDSTFLGKKAIITANTANIRTLPSTNASKLGTYPKNTFIQITGKTGNWFKVILPDEQRGFLHENLAGIISDPIQEIQLGVDTQLQLSWNEPYWVSGNMVEGNGKVWGEYDERLFIETELGIQGWLNTID